MKSPLISFCIPTYNRASFLEETIQSIVADIGNIPYEIVVSDNDSRDQTPKIAARFQNLHGFRYIRKKTNIGPVKNLLQVIDAASGEYVWMLGDDDPLAAGICCHLFRMLQTHPELDYIFVPRKLMNFDLSPLPIGIQPAGLTQDIFLREGRELYKACEGQIPGLLGFYGCNFIRKQIWQESLAELEPCFDNWFHLRIILNAIKDRPCAIANQIGVFARNNPSAEVIDSRIWIDYAVPVSLQAIEWGYPRKLCEESIRTVFRAHAFLFVLDKALGKRTGSLLMLARKLNCDRLLKWNSIWVFLSFLPRFALIPLLWLRKLRRKLRGK